jgi:sirohydrochlorin cobaltochelatase
MATQGLILFAHGARDPRWALPFEQVATRVRARRPGLAVTLAYLELMPPGLQDAGRALADAGCRVVTVLPLFLGAGGHVRKDLPALLEQLRQTHPSVQWRLEPAAGESDRLIEALALIAAESADRNDDKEPT